MARLGVEACLVRNSFIIIVAVFLGHRYIKCLRLNGFSCGFLMELELKGLTCLRLWVSGFSDFAFLSFGFGGFRIWSRGSMSCKEVEELQHQE